jgi:flagellar FliL protein
MADTTSTDTKDTDASSAKGGKGRLIVIGVLCAAIAGGGYFIGGMRSASAEEGTPEVTEVEEPEPEIVEIVELEPVNINLADGHYLRIAVALGLGEAALGEEGGGGGHGAGDEFHYETAPASDLVLTTFLGRTVDDLATPEGREQARHDLYDGLVDFYGEEVLTVFLTEFVMQ